MARQSLAILTCFWSRMINFISKHIRMAFSIYTSLVISIVQQFDDQRRTSQLKGQRIYHAKLWTTNGAYTRAEAVFEENKGKYHQFFFI